MSYGISKREMIRVKPKRASFVAEAPSVCEWVAAMLWLSMLVVVAKPPSAGKGSGPGSYRLRVRLL